LLAIEAVVGSAGWTNSVIAWMDERHLHSC
jgi:hypothetical protein